eukprot:7564936-Heterocapsa_arctica.AAC.1
MTIVGSQFEPLSNIYSKEDFLNYSGGNKDSYPHTTLDLGVTADSGFIATVFFKAWMWSRPRVDKLSDK